MYWKIPLELGTQNNQTDGDRKYNGGYQYLMQGENGELVFNRYRVPVWNDGKVLWMDGTDDCTTI